MSNSTLYKLNQPNATFAGARLSVGWANREHSPVPLVEATCVMLDARGGLLAVVDQTQPSSPDKSTQRAHHYHGAHDVFTRSVTTTLSWVGSTVAALYYAVHSPAGLPLVELQNGWVSIETLDVRGMPAEVHYQAALAEFPYCQGLAVAGLLRTGEATWHAAHLEIPVQQARCSQDLLGSIQAHMTAIA